MRLFSPLGDQYRRRPCRYEIRFPRKKLMAARSYARRRAAPVAAARREKLDPVHPEVTGDIPRIIANEEHMYEGDLIAYLKILFFESRNLNNPYHNLRHTLHVTWLCYKAVEFYRGELSPRHARNLLIAALFHDFDHPGHSHPGANGDWLNIEVAIAALRRHILPEDQDALPEIEALIRATEFPYKSPGSSLDLAGQILRDADLTQALNPAWIQQVVIGLAEEAKLYPLDVLKAQRSFLGALHLNTEWARELFPPHLVDAKIAEAESLVRLLATPDAR
jgi:hypothetical protein